MGRVQTEAEEREATCVEFGWIIGRGEQACGMLPMEIVKLIHRLPLTEDGERLDLSGYDTVEIQGLCTTARNAFLATGIPARVFESRLPLNPRMLAA